MGDKSKFKAGFQASIYGVILIAGLYYVIFKT